jgi:uracil-DNA glycosylase family 4
LGSNQTHASDPKIVEVAKINEADKILLDLTSRAEKCRRLYEGTNLVFGVGPSSAKVILVGEAPGYQEDKEGIPFVGAAGKNLNALLDEAGLRRDEVYITNVVKVRPPGNRDPTDEEIEACRPFLEGQISAIKPKLVVALGRIAARELFGRPVTRSMDLYWTAITQAWSSNSSRLITPPQPFTAAE